MAEAELARARKATTPLQDALLIIGPRVHRFLEASWRASVGVSVSFRTPRSGRAGAGGGSWECSWESEP